MFDLPNSWRMQRLKHLFDYSLSSVDRHKHDDELKVSVCHYSNAYHNEKISIDTALPEGTCTTGEFKKYKILKGDILVTKDSESPEDIGVPCLIEHNLENTVCGYHLGIIRSRTEVDPNFVFRYLQSSLVQSYFYRESFGVTRFSLGKPPVENLEIPLPSLEEQKLISLYLDNKTKQIDLLIRKIERKIELLKEQRASLISQCVTEGLDPNVKMRDSGIEWIGEIPKHWQVQKLKYLVSYNQEVLFETTDPDYEFHYIEIGDVDRSDGITINKKIRFKDSPSRARRVARPDDVIVSTVRTYLGAIGMIPNLKDVVCSTGFCVLRGKSKEINQGFLSFSVRSDWFISEINGNSYGVSYPAINSSELVESKIAVPPISEQVKIVAALVAKIQMLDRQIGYEREKVGLYREYRQALISSVVTGKMRVTEDMI